MPLDRSTTQANRSSTKPKILFVTSWIPYPLDSGGNQRGFHALKALAGIGEVTLVTYADREQAKSGLNIEPLKRLCDVHVLEKPPGRRPDSPRTCWDLARSFVRSPHPHLVENFPGRPMAEHLASISADADLIWVYRLFVSEWIRADRDRMIVDLDGLESLKERRRLRLEPAGLWRMLYSLENFKLRQVEYRAPSRYSRVVLCSDEERNFFPRKHAAKVMVMPNGVSSRLLDYPVAAGRDPTIVFVGRLSYPPNLDAALWFARSIFPRIKNAVPDVRLFLIGEHGGPPLSSLHDGRSIIVTGRVDDVAPYINRATVSVVPIRWGGGTRIKIIESLALGTPVVSTTVGAEGLGLVPGRHIYVADEPDHFAEAVLTLLRDQETRNELAVAGRAVVAERYLWDKIIHDLQQDIQDWLKCTSSVRAVGY